MDHKFVDLKEEQIHIEHPQLRARVSLVRYGTDWTLHWSGREGGIHRFDWPHYARTEEDLRSRHVGAQSRTRRASARRTVLGSDHGGRAAGAMTSSSKARRLNASIHTKLEWMGT
jgi:hypothetical protein